MSGSRSDIHAAAKSYGDAWQSLVCRHPDGNISVAKSRCLAQIATTDFVHLQHSNAGPSYPR